MANRNDKKERFYREHRDYRADYRVYSLLTAIFSTGNCEKRKEILEGLMIKNKIDWMRVPINTQLQIKGTGDPRWKNRYFAFCKDGIPYVFCGGTDSWSAENGWDSTFPITEFTECRFVDEEMEKEYWKD